MAFKTFDVGGYLVFGMPNAKNLAFGRTDVNALIATKQHSKLFNILSKILFFPLIWMDYYKLILFFKENNWISVWIMFTTNQLMF